jgi:hypothetical protein
MELLAIIALVVESVLVLGTVIDDKSGGGSDAGAS